MCVYYCSTNTYYKAVRVGGCLLLIGVSKVLLAVWGLSQPQTLNPKPQTLNPISCVCIYMHTHTYIHTDPCLLLFGVFGCLGLSKPQTLNLKP